MNRDAINQAVNKISDLTGEDFHGYRSEIFYAISGAIKGQEATIEIEKLKVIIKTSREDILTIARTDAVPLIVKMALSGIADNLKLPEIASGMEARDDPD